MNLQRVMVAAAAGWMLAAGQASAADEPALKTDKDRISYGVGVQTGRNLRKDGIEVDVDLLVRGMKEGLAGDKLLVSEKELRQIMNGFQGELRKKIAANRRILGDDNKKAGTAFMAENGKKEGVVTLPSGVQFKIVKAGDGKKPIASDVVLVNYRGTRLDGFEFDASADGKPAELQVSQLIAGWKEALQMMPSGSKWQIVVPAERAYGPRGVGQDIGPNQTLLFDVELVAIKSTTGQ
jgi:FKBP-type peptidyl-prolyl cis-trans isomerase